MSSSSTPFNPSESFTDYVKGIKLQHQRTIDYETRQRSFVRDNHKYEDSFDLLPLQMNLPCIRQVDLDRTHKMAEVEEVLVALENNTHVTSLSIFMNFGVALVQSLISMLKKNHALTHISLSSSVFKFEICQLEQLVDAIHNHPTLTSMCFVGLQISTEELAIILKLLQSPDSKITNLGLSRNLIADVDLPTILHAATQSPCIKSIGLYSNPFVDKALTRLTSTRALDATNGRTEIKFEHSF